MSLAQTTKPRPLRALFFAFSLRFYFFSFFFNFSSLSWPRVKKTSHECFFFPCSSPSFLVISRSHSRSRPSPLASHLLFSRLFLCLPGNLAVVMRRSAQPLGWWGWKKEKEVTRSCVGGGIGVEGWRRRGYGPERDLDAIFKSGTTSILHSLSFSLFFLLLVLFPFFFGDIFAIPFTIGYNKTILNRGSSVWS